MYFRLFLFFFNATAATEIYTLSLHDALPILNNRFGCTTRTKNQCFGMMRLQQRFDGFFKTDPIGIKAFFLVLVYLNGINSANLFCVCVQSIQIGNDRFFIGNGYVVTLIFLFKYII